MTQYEPSVIIRRMYIEYKGKPVYDERFHTGLNIIRGENSSGKSTILNFIFYGLGGDLADWSEIALRCERVLIEVSLNGKTATLSRNISAETGQPMDIFGGTIADALEAPQAEWVRYPYKRSTSKESFSQAIFRLLQMPEVGNNMSGNITMNQVMRLLYADQLSPIESIFKFEPFDPPTIRDAIGRLLCGAYEDQLYENELRLKGLRKEFDSISAEWRSLVSVLGKAHEGVTFEWIAAQRANLVSRRAALREEIASTEQKLFHTSTTDSISLASHDKAYLEVQRLQEEISSLRQKRDACALLIADSKHFMTDLEQKLKALNDSSLTSDFVGELSFQSCPACFAEIKSESKKACSLCKTPYEEGHIKNRVVALINDTALQLKQSQTLQSHRLTEFEKIENLLAELGKAWSKASIHLAEVRGLPSSELQESLRELQREAGYTEREAEDLENKASIAELINRLSIREAELNAEISLLESENEILRSRQMERLSKAYTYISDEIKSLLRHDLRRQDSFENPKNVQFDFAANNITVDGQRYFSASSRVILKSSFFAGFLAAAIKHSFFRHPRFCIIDTIEDKGMEPVRSHNFQLQLLRVSSEALSEHQIIFATAMIVPDLDEERYTIGKFSTRDDPTLAFLEQA